ncbi:MAG: type II toxin-antitoxin system VapC family toxin [Chloroflexi bacterium]|nr:type II toxin-antitoxin system VapC family toxin [Chloroflexota bacterium]
MRFLLDTQVFLWWLQAPERIASEAREAISEAVNEVLVSVVVVWEIGIKARTGKLQVPPNLAEWVPVELARHQFRVQPVELSHVLTLEDLPLHHRDPFDRLLIAQAQSLGVPIATADRQFAAYGARLLQA